MNTHTPSSHTSDRAPWPAASRCAPKFLAAAGLTLALAAGMAGTARADEFNPIPFASVKGACTDGVFYFSAFIENTGNQSAGFDITVTQTGSADIVVHIDLAVETSQNHLYAMFAGIPASIQVVSDDDPTKDVELSAAAPTCDGPTTTDVGSGSTGLPKTGSASGLLAALVAAMVAAGLYVVRATRRTN